MKVSVVGLGKLGSCILAVLASDHDVIGIDHNAELVRELSEGRAPFVEPGLQELLIQNKDRYRVTTRGCEAVNSDLTFIVVPTPSDPDGSFSNEYILQAVDMLGAALRLRSAPHVVAITSTVMPGSTQGPIRERLIRASGRTDVALAYSPEFIALGSVIHDLRHPDMLLVGAEDAEVQATILDALDPAGLIPAARLSTMEAEIAKLAVNAYVTTKISFANSIGEACDRYGEVDANKITAALGLDSRIGPKYLKAATAFGGPCFPRDNAAFIAFAGSAPLAEATVEINQRQVERGLIQVRRAIYDRCGIAVLGLAYKPDTPVIERAFGIDLVQELCAAGYRVTVYDPLAMDATREALGDQVLYGESAQQAVDTSGVVVITQPCPEFRDLEFGDQKIVDFWGLL